MRNQSASCPPNDRTAALPPISFEDGKHFVWDPNFHVLDESRVSEGFFGVTIKPTRTLWISSLEAEGERLAIGHIWNRFGGVPLLEAIETGILQLYYTRQVFDHCVPKEADSGMNGTLLAMHSGYSLSSTKASYSLYRNQLEKHRKASDAMGLAIIRMMEEAKTFVSLHTVTGEMKVARSKAVKRGCGRAFPNWISKVTQYLQSNDVQAVHAQLSEWRSCSLGDAFMLMQLCGSLVDCSKVSTLWSLISEKARAATCPKNGKSFLSTLSKQGNVMSEVKLPGTRPRNAVKSITNHGSDSRGRGYSSQLSANWLMPWLKSVSRHTTGRWVRDQTYV
jgi:hypothetical protein